MPDHDEPAHDEDLNETEDDEQDEPFIPTTLRVQMTLQDRMSPNSRHFEQIRKALEYSPISITDFLSNPATGFAGTQEYRRLQEAIENYHDVLNDLVPDAAYTKVAEQIRRDAKLMPPTHIFDDKMKGVRDAIDSLLASQSTASSAFNRMMEQHRATLRGVDAFQDAVFALAQGAFQSLGLSASLVPNLTEHYRELQTANQQLADTLLAASAPSRALQESLSAAVSGIHRDLEDLRAIRPFESLPNLYALLTAATTIADDIDEQLIADLERDIASSPDLHEVVELDVPSIETESLRLWFSSLTLYEKTSVLGIVFGVIFGGLGFAFQVASMLSGDASNRVVVAALQERNVQAQEQHEEELTQLKRIEGVAAEMLLALSKATGEEQDSEQYVVAKPAPLRVRPNGKSLQLGRLHPNQVLEVVKKNGPWFYVQYHDYGEGIPRMGWVYKHHLSPVELPPRD